MADHPIPDFSYLDEPGPAPALVEKPKRKGISKKTRFEVFKRDGFACQYCGAHPPGVILHVDHINPVALGGKNHMDNYVTACQPCNSGKSATSLSQVPQSLKDKAAEVAERELQIKGYQRVMDGKRARIDVEAESVRAVYEQYRPGFTLNESGMVSVRKFIDEIGVHAVRDAMERAYTRRSIQPGTEFKYFCGICWNIIKGGSDGPRTKY
jgi:hypothetical protein